MMVFEHFGINVPQPAEMADWYVRHVGMRVVRATDSPVVCRFLADRTGRVVIEIYNNPKDAVPDHSTQHPLRFHWAFAVENPAAERDRLVAAGATLLIEETLPDGSQLITVRDPWGLPLQLCRRATPFA